MFDRTHANLHHERDQPLYERPCSTNYEAVVPAPGGGSREMLYNKVSFVDRTGEVLADSVALQWPALSS
jgi:hypothetical protein